MYDVLPFPEIKAKTVEGQIIEIVDYLIQFKETLEFELTDISIENLSPELVKKLSALGMDIQQSNQNREDELSQIAIKALTVDDVLSSPAFTEAVAKTVQDIINAQTT